MSDLPEGSSFREVLKILNIGYTIKKTQEKKQWLPSEKLTQLVKVTIF